VTLPSCSSTDAAAAPTTILPALSGWPSITSVLLVADVVSTLCGKQLGVKGLPAADLANWVAQAAGA